MRTNILNLVCARVWGGGEQYVYDICAELRRRGRTSYVVVDESNRAMQQRYQEVALVLCADLYHIHGLGAISKLRSYIREQGITFLYCHSGKMMPLCLLLKRLTGIKLIFFKHNTIPSKFDWYHVYMRKYTDATICVSKLVYNLQTDKLGEKEKEKFHLVYNGIDPERFGKYAKDGKGKARSSYVIGYAGRVAPDKGLGVLLAAVKGAHDIQKNILLKLVGADEGNYYRQISNYIRQNHMEEYVIYAGLERDMEKFYRGLDLFILPSSAREAFGLVLCEAMYCEVPVVTSSSGAQAEIVTDGVNGILLNPLTVDTLQEAILGAYQNRNRTLEMARKGKEAIEQRFTITKTVEGILKVQEELGGATQGTKTGVSG